MIRQLPEICAKYKKDSKMSPESTPTKFSFKLIKSDYNDEVYILHNIHSENVKEMAFGLSTLKRILQLEAVLRKSFFNLKLSFVGRLGKRGSFEFH